MNVPSKLQAQSQAGLRSVTRHSTIIQLLQERHFADHTSEPAPFPFLVVASKILNLSESQQKGSHALVTVRQFNVTQYLSCAETCFRVASG